MDIQLFTQIIRDKSYNQLSEIKYKYGLEQLNQYIKTLEDGFYKEISLTDFEGLSVVYLPSKIHMTTQKMKI